MTTRGDENSKFARDAWIRALTRTATIAERGITLSSAVGQWGRQSPGRCALISPEATLSYGQLAARSNQYARWAQMRGLKPGDAVCLIMSNCAEYMAVWLGLTRAGVIVALINTNLVGESLAYAVNTAAPKAIIVGTEFGRRVGCVQGKLQKLPVIRMFGKGSEDFACIEPELEQCALEVLNEAEVPAPPMDATALYIYTSGTTGLPKAARVSHYRIMQWSQWFAGLMNTIPSDRLFNCLPLYHSVGGVVATGSALVSGAAVVIRSRFKAGDFWRDVYEERCTLFQYIGELCRYLVNSPYQESETAHSLRLACGNGLRPEVWERFRHRFKIPRILEYYASTEGNFSLYNCEGEPGAIGRIPPFLAQKLPVALLRFDAVHEQPLRNAQGFCEACSVNEVGEAVGSIPADAREHAGRFEGYTERNASEDKLLRNVFTWGDRWYRSGDLMRRDERGFYYFVDRVGETYRWKGENVSTAEVLTALCATAGVLDGVVYGIVLPGIDGRVGVAALKVDARFDLAAFRADTAQRLPSYARPIFLRLIDNLESTGTFKSIKLELTQAGVDPALVKDPLYFDDRAAQRYIPLDAALFAAISRGEIRL